MAQFAPFTYQWAILVAIATGNAQAAFIYTRMCAKFHARELTGAR